MCIKILKNGLKCKIKCKKSEESEKTNQYCHIHKNKIQEEGLEIKNNKLNNHNTILLIEIVLYKNEIINLKKEIINLNKTVEKKNNNISSKNTQLDIFKKNNNELSKKLIESKEFADIHIKKFKSKLINKENILMKYFNEIETMKEDYDKFQIIKKFEIYKYNLIKKGINVRKYDNYEYNKLRYERNYIVHLAFNKG